MLRIDDELTLDTLTLSTYERLRESGLFIKDIEDVLIRNSDLSSNKVKEEFFYWREQNGLIRKRYKKKTAIRRVSLV